MGALSGVLGLLGRIPVLAWVIAGLTALALWNGHKAKSVRADFETAKVHAAAARAADIASAAVEGARRVTAQQEVLDAQAKELERLSRAHGALLDSGRQLRARLAAVQAERCGADPQASGASQAAAGGGDPGDLSALVQRRLDEAAEGIARHADTARVRGLGCEGSYDALTPDGGSP
jgi:hypothetical protein